MKKYSDPEIKVVCFETADMTNFSGGEGPDVPGDELSTNAKGWFFPQW